MSPRLMSDDHQPNQKTTDGPTPDKYCAHCEERLIPGEWQPVVTHTEKGSVVAIDVFCDSECKAMWRAEQ